MKYTIIRHISTIKKWSTTSLELNIVKWGENPEKYDLRLWKYNTPGKRGMTLTLDELRNLHVVIGKEFDSLELDGDEFELIDDESEYLFEE